MRVQLDERVSKRFSRGWSAGRGEVRVMEETARECGVTLASAVALTAAELEAEGLHGRSWREHGSVFHG